MYLIFYDLDSLTQNAVDIKRFGNTVAVLLYAAALPLFIREDRREQLAECGYGDKQYDRQEQERFDPGVSRWPPIFLNSSTVFSKNSAATPTHIAADTSMSMLLEMTGVVLNILRLYSERINSTAKAKAEQSVPREGVARKYLHDVADRHQEAAYDKLADTGRFFALRVKYSAEKAL